MPKCWDRTKEYLELKAGLEDNLAARGLVEPIYADMLRRYLDLWVEYKKLTEDIKERGVVVWDNKRGMHVENRSLAIRHQTANKMLDIYTALGFKEISTGKREIGGNDEL